MKEYLAKFESKLIVNTVPSSPHVDTGCWEWRAAKTKKGYGLFCVASKLIYAHRFSFEAYKGEITTGLFVCHRCDNKSCVNPNHLFLGSAKDNSEDMVKKGRANFCSLEHREQISEKMTGRIFSEEHKQKLSKVHEGNSYRLGKKHSEYSKQKMSNTKKLKNRQ
jgi:hypothetical protein